ncbi:MAG: AAA family ATPase [Thermoleophilia bacterium]
MSSNGQQATRGPLRFTRLRLENWRNFRLLDVLLQRRMFVVGPNAAGKSNLLDAVRFLSDMVTVGGGFEAAVTKPHRGSVSMLRSLAARRYPDIGITVEIGTDEVPKAWTYELSFGQDNQRRPIIKRERVLRLEEELLARPDPDDEKDPARLRQTHLEQVNVNREFRDVADFFASVRYRHIVPQLVREPDRSVGRRNDPYGGDFLETLASTSERTQQARLRRIRDALAVAVPQLEELQLFRDDRGTPHLRGKYKHWRSQGHWQSEEHFSDGTLRLLGLLWSVLDGSGPLVLEEPELSLHDEVTRFIPQMFAQVQRRTGRQIIVSTHSPRLVGDPGVGLDEVLVLTPGLEGSEGRLAADIPEIADTVNLGVPLDEVLLALTRPDEVSQLSLFGR